MAEIPAFLPIVLHWRPVGGAQAQAVANAYCVLEIAEPASAELLRRKVGEASIIQVGAARSLHIVARTDSRGVLNAVASPAAGAPDSLSPSALSPLLFPLGTKLKIWRTESRDVFERVMRTDANQRSPDPLELANPVVLAFDAATELPRALEAILVELDNGPELRERLLQSRPDCFPAALLQLADDGRTWCVELHDRSLELALDCALCIQELAAGGEEHRLPAHQLLLDKVVDILRRRARDGDPFQDVAARHERLCGPEYRALREDLATIVRRTAQGVDAAGKTLLALYVAAFQELSIHPYPEGQFESREPGPISRKWTSKLLLDAAALALRDEIEQKL